MFYTFVLQVVVLILIVGVMSQSNVGSNQQVKMDYYKIEMIYQKEFMIKEAIERHVYDYGVLPLTVQDLKDNNELSDNFVNSNSVDIAGNFTYEVVNNNYVRIKHKISDNTLRRVYLNHYKGLGSGIKPWFTDTDTDGINDDTETEVYHEFQLSNDVVDILKGRGNDGEGYIPVGAIQAFAVDYGTVDKCPIGWVLANGGFIDVVSYPVLAEYFGYPTNPTPILPDLRGEFLRGVDDGRGIDLNVDLTSRTMLSYQANDQKSFTLKSEQEALTVNTGSVYMDKYTSDHNNNEFFTGKWEMPGTKVNLWWDNSEVRPRNIAVRYCIKHDYN